MKLFYTLLFSFLLFSCRVQPIQFQKIENISLKQEDKKLYVTANVSLYNPNNYACRLKGVHLNVDVNGSPTAIIKQKMNMKISPQNSFSVPVEAHLSMEGGWFNSLKNILFSSSQKIEFNGYVRVKKNILHFRIPVKYQTEVKR